MSAQIIRFPVAKKRGAKVKRGPCAEVFRFSGAVQRAQHPTSTRYTTDQIFNDFLQRRGISRAVTKPAPKDGLDERFNAFLVKRGIVSEPESV